MTTKGLKCAGAWFMLALGFTSCKKDSLDNTAIAEPAPIESKSDTIAGHYLVLLNSNTTVSSSGNNETLAEIVQRKAIEVMSATGAKSGSVYEVYSNALQGFAAKMTKEQAELLKKNPDVAVVEPDRTIKLPEETATLPGKNSSSSLAQTTPWGISRIGGAGGGTGITVWIVDSGVDLDHPDLSVDAIRSRSFLPNISSADDQNGHGTHVAGIINAKNNDIGVVGIAPDSKVVSLRVLDGNGSGSLSYSISAFDYIASRAKVGDVVNYSVGPGSRYTSTILDNAVKNVAYRGIKFVMAAGNSADNTAYYSPARLRGTNIFVVSAVSNSNTFASFSNYGTSVTHAAPGVSIVSTYKDGQYATMSGTSMASPHVAGILAAIGKVNIDGYCTGDRDGKADPIAHR
jgi:subtilisin family serine protease